MEYNSRLGDKVYSPDLTVFELEGPAGLFGTIASIFVGPIRIVVRVMHNIFVLPAHMLKSYSEGLLCSSIALLLLGAIDYAIFGKWPLLVSQVPLILYALHLRRKAARAIVISKQKREVTLDTAHVSEMCNAASVALDQIVTNGESNND